VKTLTHIPDPKRYQFCIVHDNGRSLYIVDWRMVVVEGEKCSTPCEKKEEIVREVKCPGGICPGECPDPQPNNQRTTSYITVKTACSYVHDEGRSCTPPIKCPPVTCSPVNWPPILRILQHIINCRSTLIYIDSVVRCVCRGGGRLTGRGQLT